MSVREVKNPSTADTIEKVSPRAISATSQITHVTNRTMPIGRVAHSKRCGLPNGGCPSLTFSLHAFPAKYPWEDHKARSGIDRALVVALCRDLVAARSELAPEPGRFDDRSRPNSLWANIWPDASQVEGAAGLQSVPS